MHVMRCSALAGRRDAIAQGNTDRRTLATHRNNAEERVTWQIVFIAG